MKGRPEGVGSLLDGRAAREEAVLEAGQDPLLLLQEVGDVALVSLLVAFLFVRAEARLPVPVQLLRGVAQVSDLLEDLK